MLFCGVDTSNYTTSLALADGEGRVIANLKEPLPVKAGECGLRQSDAVFAHTRNLPLVTARAARLCRALRGEDSGVRCVRNAAGRRGVVYALLSYRRCGSIGDG